MILQLSLSLIIRLNITYANYSITVKVNIKDGNTSCFRSETEPEYTSCSKHYSQKKCLKYCASGSANGSCEWRPPVTESKNLQINYGTCSPSLAFCPDRICDPLEQLGQKIGMHICPQDCTSFVTGSGRINDKTNKGVFSGKGICTCDDVGKCSCLTQDEWIRSEISEPKSVLLSELKFLGSQSKLQDKLQKSDPYCKYFFFC